MTWTPRSVYRNCSGSSPIRYYAISASAIRVWYESGVAYEYDGVRPGRAHVEEMKRLASQGQGLATYISQHVRENYSRKF